MIIQIIGLAKFVNMAIANLLRYSTAGPFHAAGFVINSWISIITMAAHSYPGKMSTPVEYDGNQYEIRFKPVNTNIIFFEYVICHVLIKPKGLCKMHKPTALK